MTNDELEAYRAMPGVMDNRSLGNALRDKLPGILDEVERLRGLIDELEFLRAEDEASFRNTEARATRAEAHAERLAKALAPFAGEVPSSQFPGCGEFTGADLKEARSALAAYRGVKDEACSRPSDALDAPVQPTSSSSANG